jgi:hypothetical protein
MANVYGFGEAPTKEISNFHYFFYKKNLKKNDYLGF